MTIQTYWIFKGNKETQETDPLIIKWIAKLNLHDQNIVIKHEAIDGYARFTLQYDQDTDYWIIGMPMGFDIYHALHKLGYIWIWNNTKIIDKVKENWRKKTDLIALAESCILDNIVFYNFCKMDKEFKDFWFGYVIEDLAHFYKGASWNKELPNMIYTYIVNYLTWNYVLGQEEQNKYSNYIMDNLAQE